MALLLIPVPRSGARPLLLLLVWSILATGLQWPLRSMAPSSLETVFVSDNANSFYSVTRRHEPTDVLRQFNRVRASAPLHVQSNMPGKLMLLYALQLVSTRTDVLPWLVIGLSNLGAILVYLFVRDLFDDSRTAFVAGALYLFVPARHFFFPLLNTVTPIAILTCGWLLVRWLRTGATAYAALMGLGLYGLVFFEPLPLVMGLLFAALVLAAIGRGEVAWDRFLAQTGVVIFVFIGTSEAVAASSGFDAVRAFRSIGTHAVEFNESTGRPYWVWVRANLWEFVFGSRVLSGDELLRFGVVRSAGSEPLARTLDAADHRPLSRTTCRPTCRRRDWCESRRSHPAVDLSRLLLSDSCRLRLHDAWAG